MFTPVNNLLCTNNNLDSLINLEGQRKWRTSYIRALGPTPNGYLFWLHYSVSCHPSHQGVSLKMSNSQNGALKTTGK